MNGHWRCTCKIWVLGMIGVAAIVLLSGLIPYLMLLIPSDDHSKNDTAPTKNTMPTKLNLYDDVTEMINQENEESNLISSASNPTNSRAIKRSTENPSFVNDILLWTRWDHKLTTIVI